MMLTPSRKAPYTMLGHPTSMIPPSSLAWSARPGHLHPFVHRLTKEILPWFNPFNELTPILSLLIQPWCIASGHKQTSHIHRSSDQLPPALWLFSHPPLPKLAQCSKLLGYLNPGALCVITYLIYHPMAQSLSAIWTIIISWLSVHTGYIFHRAYPSAAHHRHGLLQRHTYRHTDVPMVDWALVSLYLMWLTTMVTDTCLLSQ